MSRQYHIKNIRILLIEGFTDKELRDLCFETPDFEPIYHQLAENSGKTEIVRQLLEYAKQKLLIDQLLTLVRELNPARYEQHQPYYDDLSAGPFEPFEPETISIPAGPFLMGSLEGEHVQGYELPQHTVDLPDYRIGTYPVTNGQYAEFVKQTKHSPPQKAGWFGKNPPENKLDYPVVGVNWYDAWDYCRWLSERTGRIYRLPKEAEWEKAARGTDGRLYPWGNEWETGRCNCLNAQTMPVMAYPAGQSPYGCYDMIGNVWEWTSTLWGQHWQKSDFPYPYRPDDGREDLKADVTVYRLFRGGSFDDEITQLRCSARRWFVPTNTSKTRGFRVVLEV